MTRPTKALIDPSALLHNIRRVQILTSGRDIIAMVKANAYGCGLSRVLPILEGHVTAFGVASLEEALAIRKLGSRTSCVLFQGVFNPEEWLETARHQFQCVIHQTRQLQWLLNTPLQHSVKIWVKIDTGMHRLGFDPSEAHAVIQALHDCPWVENEIGVMTHLARSDEPHHASNLAQLKIFQQIDIPSEARTIQSIANSAAILALPETHADVVRPGIMLYGVSPFPGQEGRELDLLPVMHFMSAISAIHHFPPHAPIGYGGTWSSEVESIIGIIPAGYGDGYPRHVKEGTPVWVNGMITPIVGRISMDMMAVNLSHCPGVKEGDAVELWGSHLPIETIAASAGTIPYELLCQLSPRVRHNDQVVDNC